MTRSYNTENSPSRASLLNTSNDQLLEVVEPVSHLQTCIPQVKISWAMWRSHFWMYLQGKRRALSALGGVVGLCIFFILLKFASGETLSYLIRLLKLTLIHKEAKRRMVSVTFRTRFSPKPGGKFTTRKLVRLPRIVTPLCTLDGTGDKFWTASQFKKKQHVSFHFCMECFHLNPVFAGWSVK